MLDLGIWEIVVIAVVALLVLKPEDLPDLLRTMGRAFGKLKSMGQELSEVVHQVTHETGINELRQDMKKIVDLEGNVREAYDVTAIEEMERKE